MVFLWLLKLCCLNTGYLASSEMDCANVLTCIEGWLSTDGSKWFGTYSSKEVWTPDSWFSLLRGRKECYFFYRSLSCRSVNPEFVLPELTEISGLFYKCNCWYKQFTLKLIRSCFNYTILFQESRVSKMNPGSGMSFFRRGFSSRKPFFGSC